jgi:hypothetical protein
VRTILFRKSSFIDLPLCLSSTRYVVTESGRMFPPADPLET